MKFKLLLTFLIKNDLLKKFDKKKILTLAIIGICFLPLIAIGCISIYQLSLAMAVNGLLPQMMTLIISSVQIFQLFFIIRTFSSRFFSSLDNEFLAALPVSHNEIFWAKFLIVYIEEFGFSFLMVTPFLFTTIGAALKLGVSFGVGFYFMLIPIYILTPLVPILLVALFSMPMMFIGSFLKQRGALSSILLIIFYLGIMVGYFFLVPNIGSYIENGIKLSNEAVRGIDAATNVFYFTKCLFKLGMGIDTAKNFGISFAIFVLLLVSSILMAMATYKKCLTSYFESANNNGGGEIKYRGRSKISALMLRDFKQLIRVPSMALNCISPVFLAPLLMIVLKFTNVQYATLSDFYSVGFILMISLMMSPGMNFTAMLAFSREGKAFTFLKHLPFDNVELFKSKLFFATIVSIISSVAVMLIAVIVYKTNALNSIFIGLILFTVSIAVNSLGIYCDSKKPNLNWKSVNEISKRNFSSMFPFLSCLVLSIAIFGLAVVMETFGGFLSNIVKWTIFWCVTFVITTVLAILSVIFLSEKTVENLNKLTGEEI